MIDADAKGEWGPTGAFGYYKRSNDNLGSDILGVFTLTNHVVGGEKLPTRTASESPSEPTLNL